MSRKIAQLWLLVFIFFSAFTLVQAQLPRLPWPRNLHVYDDALHWDAVEHASGYRVSLPGISSRGWITAEVSQNRYDLRDLRYDYVYYTFVEAISADPAQYQDSSGSTLYHLTRPRPTPTPPSTPTATPSPTPTRVFLRGIDTPTNTKPPPPPPATDPPPTATLDPYVEECLQSKWVSYTVTEQLPVGHCPGFGLPCLCTRSCKKQCCSGNTNRCWNHQCGDCVYTSSE